MVANLPQEIGLFISGSQKMLNTIGWIGAALLSLCGIPEAYRSWKLKSCSIGWGFLSMWGIGEVLLLIYILPKWDLPLIVNYLLNILCIIILCYYKVKRR